jgi:hypothetical protein
MRYLVNLTLLVFISFITKGQILSDKQSILKGGVFIESINVLVPWKSRLSDSAKIGSPKLSQLNGKNLDVSWDSVKILNGLNVTLKGYFRMAHGDWHLIHFYSIIDSAELARIKTHLDSYFQKSGVRRGERKKAFFYEWKSFGCMLRLGRFPAGEKFGLYNDKYYVWLQKM